MVEPTDLVPYQNQRLQRTGLLGGRQTPKTAFQDGQLQPGSVERVADLVGEARGQRTDRRHALCLEVFPVGVKHDRQLEVEDAVPAARPAQEVFRDPRACVSSTTRRSSSRKTSMAPNM